MPTVTNFGDLVVTGNVFVSGTGTSTFVSGLTSGGTVTAPTFTGAAFNGGTFAGSTVSGTTITASTGFTGAAFTGGTFQGSTVSGTTITASTGFTGAAFNGGTFIGSTITASTGFTGAAFTGGTFQGSTVSGTTITASTGFTGAAFTGGTFQGSTMSGTTITASTGFTGAAFTGGTFQGTTITASTAFTGAAYYGNGANLTGVSPISGGTTNAVAYATGATTLATSPGIILTNPTLSNGTVLLTCSGDIVAYSDRNIKTNIEIIPNALEKVARIGGYTFNRIDGGSERRTGVIAQEIQEVLPEAVYTTENGTLTVAYGNMVGLLIEAIKEERTKREELEKRILTLELNSHLKI